MKLKVTKFKSPEVALKELEPFIRDGRHLYTGKPFGRFGELRSRELVANWMICAVLNAGRPSNPFVFTSDPEGGDGIIYDAEEKIDWQTEHVMVPKAAPGERRDIADLIADAVTGKQAKGGAAYARGKVLVVFLDAGLGDWSPNRVGRQLPLVDFKEVWVVGLHGDVRQGYVYGVTQLNLSGGNAPICLVRIAKTFDSWTVQRLQ
jgi:hypothetical protein